MEAEIIEGIWDDINGRSGGDHFLGDLDDDIIDEIKDSWRAIIKAAVALKGKNNEET